LIYILIKQTEIFVRGKHNAQQVLNTIL